MLVFNHNNLATLELMDLEVLVELLHSLTHLAQHTIVVEEAVLVVLVLKDKDNLALLAQAVLVNNMTSLEHKLTMPVEAVVEHTFQALDKLQTVAKAVVAMVSTELPDKTRQDKAMQTVVVVVEPKGNQAVHLHKVVTAVLVSLLLNTKHLTQIKN